MSEKEISNFLRKVSIKIESLKEAKRMYGNQIAPDFFIFDYLRKDELGLSKCIGNLLNPNGKHGQGDVFLKQFLIQTNQLLKIQMSNASQDEELGKKTNNAQTIHWDTVNTENCKIKLEQGTDEQRHVDIFLKFADGEMIGIENKPSAADQKNQLLDYATFVERQAVDKPWLLIYLCNTQPSKESISDEVRIKREGSGNLITVSYDELIQWLEVCIQHAKAPVVRTFIEELIKYILKDINGVADMTSANEVAKIILQDGNFEAAIHVSNALDNAKRELIVQLKKDLINATEGKYYLNWEKSMDSEWSRYCGFGINFDSERLMDFEISFEFMQQNLKRFYWGIRRRDEKVEKISEHWSQINNSMNAKFGLANQTLWWPWLVYYEPDANNNFINWESNVEPWNAIKDGTLVENIMRTVNEVHQHFVGSNKMDLLKTVQPLINNDFPQASQL